VNKGIISRRLGRKSFIAGLFVAALTALITSAPATAANWQQWQLDGDYCYDAVTLDADRNGNSEQAWFDMDNDCRWDTHLYNTRGSDALLEQVGFDMDENGVAEYLMMDINQRVGFEWLYVDRNQDRVYEQRRIIPGSDLDLATRVNTNNANNAILHQFTMRTGQSLLYPSFPTP
jgi:hypothetical protein